jgi:hypothetical protein
MHRRQIGDGGVDARAEVGVGRPFGQRGNGMAAAGTEQGVQAILCFDGDDRGQFNDLMSQGLSRRVKQALRKRLPAVLTVERENVVDGIHLLGGQQLPFLAFMARLTALTAFTRLFAGFELLFLRPGGSEDGGREELDEFLVSRATTCSISLMRASIASRTAITVSRPAS